MVTRNIINFNQRQRSGKSGTMATAVRDVNWGEAIEHLLVEYFEEVDTKVHVAELWHKIYRNHLFVFIEMDKNQLDTCEVQQESKELSPREIEIIYLIARGYSNKQIAYALQLSVATVATYIRRALLKSNSSSRAELVFYALKCGFIHP